MKHHIMIGSGAFFSHNFQRALTLSYSFLSFISHFPEQRLVLTTFIPNNKHCIIILTNKNRTQVQWIGKQDNENLY